MRGKAFVIHATSLTEREASIRRQLGPLGMECEFVTKYDIDGLTEEVLGEHFVKGIDLRPSELSCAMKHIHACQLIVERGLDGALVFEDDIVLHRNFKEVFAKSLAEMQGRCGDPCIVSYEDSTLQFVPRSQRRKGQVLYKGETIRCLGAYYMTRGGARAVLDTLRQHKCSCPIDHFYQHCHDEGVLDVLWCHPCTATQGSAMGTFSSSLRSRKHGMMRMRWFFKLWYKKSLYLLK